MNTNSAALALCASREKPSNTAASCAHSPWACDKEAANFSLEGPSGTSPFERSAGDAPSRGAREPDLACLLFPGRAHTFRDLRGAWMGVPSASAKKRRVLWT
jgi:hypothetical protein